MRSGIAAARLGWLNTLTWLRILIAVTLALLVVQFVLGMEINIYLTPPYSSSNGTFSLHYSLGILSLGFGLAILAVSVLTRHVTPVLTSVAGFLALAIAGEAGREFAFSGQSNFLSLVMSLGFIIAFSSYYSEALALRRIVAYERPSGAI